MKLREILHTIEGVTYEDLVMSPEKKLSLIYRFAHVGVGRCENKHKDWMAELENTNKALKKMGIIGEVDSNVLESPFGKLMGVVK